MPAPEIRQRDGVEVRFLVPSPSIARCLGECPRPANPRRNCTNSPVGKHCGSVPRLLKNPAMVMEEFLRKHDGIYGTWLGSQQIVVTDDPACAHYLLQSPHHLFRKPAHTYGALARALGNGLLTSDGERWQRHRKAIQPGFHPSRIAALGKVMVEESSRLADRLGVGNDPVDRGAAMVQLTATIMARALFGESLPEEDFARVRESHEASEKLLVREIRAPFLLPWLRLTGQVRRVEASRAAAREILIGVIAKRRASGQPHDDLLQMLLDARFEDSGEGLTDEDILAKAMTFYMAGHETSAHALTWFLYETGVDLDLQSRLRAEQRSACGDREPVASDLASFPLLRSCIEETLRLHPPAWILDREPVEEVTLAGHRIPPHRLVAICLYAMHRRPDLWSEPATFRPDRFLANDVPGRPTCPSVPDRGNASASTLR